MPTGHSSYQGNLCLSRRFRISVVSKHGCTIESSGGTQKGVHLYLRSTQGLMNQNLRVQPRKLSFVNCLELIMIQ